MPNLIACRFSSYGRFRDRAWKHLPQIGIHHVEVHLPVEGEVEGTMERLARHGLTVTSVQARCDLSSPDVLDSMRGQLQTITRMGARICLLCVAAGELPLERAYSLLRELGDLADGFGLTLAMETHPDLVTNSATARQTIHAVDHPRVRVNFDPANVYYYNNGLDAVRELEDIADIVAGIHLKDTPGGYQDRTFPALGQGIVDFPAIFHMMSERGFSGAYTIELEPQRGREDDEANQIRLVEESVAYLRRIGAMA